MKLKWVLQLAFIGALIGAIFVAGLILRDERESASVFGKQPTDCAPADGTPRNWSLIELAGRSLIRYQQPHSPTMYNFDPLSDQPGGPYRLWLLPERVERQSLVLAVRGRESTFMTLQTGIYRRAQANWPPMRYPEFERQMQIMRSLEVDEQMQVKWSPNGRWLMVKVNQPDLSQVVTVHGPFPTEGEALPTGLRTRTKTFPKTALFTDWSPDSRHLAYIEAAKQEVFLWDVEADTHTPYLMDKSYDSIYGYGSAWSPDGQHVALIFDFAYRSHLVRVTVGGGVYQLDIERLVPEVDLAWSPDSRHVAVKFPDSAYHVLHSDNTLSKAIDSASMVIWAADSRTLYAIKNDSRDFPASSWALLAYDVLEKTLTPLLDNLPARPVPSPVDSRRVAVVGASDGTLTVMNIDGSEPVVLVPAADQIGAAYWSPDGAYVGAAWQRAGKPYLTWARADGTAIRTWGEDGQGGLSAASSLNWMSDQVVFIAERRTPAGSLTYNFESVRLADGEHRVWLAGKQKIGYLAQSPGGVLQVWWEDNRQVGVVGYVAKTAQVKYAYTVPDSRLNPYDDVPPEAANSAWPHLIRAPMGSAAIIRLNYEEYRFIFGDGQQVTVTMNMPNNLAGLHASVAFSDDGQVIAIFERIARVYQVRLFSPTEQEVIEVNRRGVVSPAQATCVPQ